MTTHRTAALVSATEIAGAIGFATVGEWVLAGFLAVHAYAWTQVGVVARAAVTS